MTSLFRIRDNSKTGQRGFTLIELLVVISIIALLSSIVLAALGTARQKGQYAAVQESLVQMRNVYEVQYLNSNSYSTLMPSGIFGTPYSHSDSHYACSVNLSTANYNNYCNIYDAIGCQNIYGSGPAYPICVDITNKIGSSGTFYIGVIGGATAAAAATDYSFAVTNPSNAGSLFCLRSTGASLVTTTYSNCLTRTLW